MCVRMRRINVPFPPPEGELMTKRISRSVSTGGTGDSFVSDCKDSLNVLHLLAQLFHFRLDRQRGLFDRHVG